MNPRPTPAIAAIEPFDAGGQQLWRLSERTPQDRGLSLYKKLDGDVKSFYNVT